MIDYLLDVAVGIPTAGLRGRFRVGGAPLISLLLHNQRAELLTAMLMLDGNRRIG